jgi:hypothetical protein
MLTDYSPLDVALFTEHEAAAKWLCVPVEGTDGAALVRSKYWEIIANRLMKDGWSLGWVSAVDADGQTIWIADAHRDDGKRFVVRTDEKLSAFLELESAIRACGELV